MEKVKNGMAVSADYKKTLQNGEGFDNCRESDFQVCEKQKQ